MNVQTQIDTDFAPHHRAFRRPDRRRRHLRRRRAPITSPRNARARASSCWKPRRPSAAPGPPTAIPASAPTATSTPSATASSRGPAAPIASAAEILKYMGEVIEENDLARHIRYQHTDHLGDMVERGQPLDHRGHAHRHRRDASLHHQLPLDVPGLLPPHRGLYAGVEGHGQLQGPDRPSAEMARRSRLQEQARRRDRLGRHGGDADPGDGRRLRACHHAAALADLFPHRPQRDRDRRGAARSCRSTRSGSTRSRGARSCSTRTPSPARLFEEPEAAKKDLLSAVEAYLGKDYDIATHFTPSYRPWRQRIAFIPDGDLFQGIKSGKASVVTDEIDRFTEKGILLKSGKELEADIIVTATGFNLSANGDIDFADRRQAARFRRHRDLSRHDVHRRAEHGLGVRLFPRQLDAARRPGRRLRLPAAQAHEGRPARRRSTPQLRPEDHDMPLLPWIDPENFNPGYMMRGMHLLPKRGDKPEWQHNQDYWAEKDEFPAIDLEGQGVRLRLRPGSRLGSRKPLLRERFFYTFSRTNIRKPCILIYDHHSPS